MNETVSKELALELDTGLHLVANFTWDDFKFWIKLSNPEFISTTATSSKVELEYHNWDDELTAVLKGITDDLNIRFGEEFDMRNYTKWQPYVKYAAGFFPHTMLSPFVADEFLFAGFSMIGDQ